jgi:hypothetical protein
MTEVAYIEDVALNYAALVFRVSNDETLEIQRALVFDQQDQDLGMDAYCLVVNAGPTYYGGVDDWHIDDDVLQLVLGPEAAQTLGVPTALRLMLSPTEVPLVREHLPALLSR